jgi:tRNA threonylcarbamoyladenosine biosynthesis protein TsaE
MTTTTETVASTRRVAATLARELKPGDVVALEGDLGAGKTAFVQGVAEALGVEGSVTSPTFTLINEYRGPVMLYHMDLYRLGSEAEMEAIGIEDYLYGDGICLVEWAEKLGTLRPPGIIRVTIEHGGEDIRHITIEREEAT